MKYHVKIGTLAKYFGISKQTLIHYDKVDLLKPTYKGENNYRYYSYEHMDKLDMILNLKEAGLKLNEIRDFMKSPSMEENIHLLTSQSTKLEKHILELQKLKQKMDYRVSELQYVKDIVIHDEIKLQNKKPRYILREDSQKKLTGGLDIFNQFKKFLENDETYSKYAHAILCVIIKKDAIESGNFNKLNGVFIFIDEYTHQEKEYILEPGLYVCAHHKGAYSETERTYEKMLDYIKTHELEIIGDAIELPIIGAWAAISAQHYVTEIQIPVRKEGS